MRPENRRSIDLLFSQAFSKDRAWARFRLRRLGGWPGGGNAEADGQALAAVRQRLEASAAARRRRIDERPRIAAYPELPIVEKKDAIVEAIERHPVVIVSGETGSGKTTQLPKFCLDAGRGIEGWIGCTQPRRIAAIAVAQRIAEELGEPVGGAVGYKIRFREEAGRDPFIKVMTDGILLAEARSDPLLRRYDTLIIDEAHERSLNIDFLLGIVKGLLARRRDLKLIVTSATIDTETFSAAFGDAPVIEVSGRLYPVEVRYRPLAESGEEEQNHVDAVVRELTWVLSQGPFGDVLIFLPTEQSIRDAQELIEGRRFPGVTVLPLFARLTASEQARVFGRPAGRKVILATNIAETSLTIPGIRYVIDTGLARIGRYLPRTRPTTLPVTPISRSSADQRKGRCGLVENGVCIRLYPEDDYNSRERFTPPEILRANLADVFLRMIALRIGAIDSFPFIDAPSPQRIRDGIDLLLELGAIHPNPSPKAAGRGDYRLTPRGRLMAEIPIDPRLSRILIEAHARGCLSEVTVIAAALSMQDPRERPVEKEAEADRAQEAFRDPNSDFLTLLNIWRAYHAAGAQNAGDGTLKRWCRSHFLSYRRMREWRDLFFQIKDILEENASWPAGADPVPPAVEAGKTPFANSRYAAIHQALASGFLSNIAARKEKQIFTAARGKEVMIFPGSGLFKNPGPWVVAAEMVETSRLFARTCAVIDPGWLEALGGDLCVRAYQNPRWERRRGEVVVDEQVTLFGLAIVSGRSVAYRRIDAADAADIFVRSALVAGDLRQPLAFMEFNRLAIEAVGELEDRVRRRDILVDTEDLVQFYLRRLPAISDIRSLKRLLREKGDEFLRLTDADLLRYRPDPNELSQYPEGITVGGERFDVSYRFDPGAEDDGLTVRIPSTKAAGVDPKGIDWLVPGMLAEKIESLIRGLPKSQRRRLMPAAPYVATIVAELPRHDDRPLVEVLSSFLRRRFGIEIPISAWPGEGLPDHLRARIAIVAADGRTVASGRDPAILSGHTAEAVPEAALQRLRRQWESDAVTDEAFPDLPESLTAESGDGRTWTVWPALAVEENGNVALRLFSDGRRAAAAHRAGVIAHFCRRLKKDLAFLKKRLHLPADAVSMAGYFGGGDAVAAHLFQRACEDLFGRDIRRKSDFEAHAESIRPRLSTAGDLLRDRAADVIRAYHATRGVLYDLDLTHRGQPAVAGLIAGLRTGLEQLVPAHFVRLYDPERLAHVVRYIRAVAVRAERAVIDLEKDRQKAAAVERHAGHLATLLSAIDETTSLARRSAVEDYFWMLEEFKVSVFAQELKTAVKISEKRLEKQRAEIDRIA